VPDHDSHFPHSCSQPHELITFLILDSPVHPVVLGFPWLQLHNPPISWTEIRLLGWSQECQGRCLSVSICPTSVESPDQAIHVPILEEYWDLQVAFSKTRATCLPPHCPWDSTINLLPGSTLPRGHIYPLSHAETEAMEVYICSIQHF
jgi:hypothetical protein